MCWCDPEKRTPICDTCPPDKKAQWPQYQLNDSRLEVFSATQEHKETLEGMLAMALDDKAPWIPWPQQIRALRFAIATLSAQAEYANQWKPVEDGLPDKTAIYYEHPTMGRQIAKQPLYLVSTSTGRVFATSYTGLGWANVGYSDAVTAWMPLPEPHRPEQGKEENVNG